MTISIFLSWYKSLLFSPTLRQHAPRNTVHPPQPPRVLRTHLPARPHPAPDAQGRVDEGVAAALHRARARWDGGGGRFGCWLMWYGGEGGLLSAVWTAVERVELRGRWEGGSRPRWWAW